MEAGKSSSRKRQDSLQQGALMFANAEEEFFYEVRMPRFISVSSSSCS
jgi:protein BCP1